MSLDLSVRRTVAFLASAAAIAASSPAPLLAADPPDKSANPTPTKDSEPFPITLRVTPGIVLVGKPGSNARAGATAATLTFAGETLPAGQRAVAITIRSDSGADGGAQQVIPDAKGNYVVYPPSPTKAGTYEVVAVAPDGRGKASAKFRAVEPSGLGAQAESVLNEAVNAAADGVAAAEAKVEGQPDSPVKEKAKAKLADAKRVLGELRSHSGGAAVKGLIGAISSDAALQESYRPKMETLTKALDDTASETERVRKLTANMSSGDVGCHQLAFVAEVFKGVSALLNVKKRVLDTSIGFARDIVSDATGNKAKALGAGSALAFASGQAAKNLPELESATKLAGNAVSILTDLGAFVTDTLFGMFCEQFTGPLNAVMNARLFTRGRAADPLALYWSYNYKLTGRVVVYYPKNAKGGGPIRLNGRLEGYAHGFENWEDALTAMFPQLMAGAMQKKFNYPPIEMGESAAGVASQGGARTSAYVEGSAAGALLPNSFFIPVEGVLEKNTMTLVLGQAKMDITATHRVAVLILAPMAGGLGPQITWYPLRFQKVRPFLVNAIDGESMKLEVKTVGEKLVAQGVFTGKVDKPTAKGDYTLTIKACNPSC